MRFSTQIASMLLISTVSAASFAANTKPIENAPIVVDQTLVADQTVETSQKVPASAPSLLSDNAPAAVPTDDAPRSLSALIAAQSVPQQIDEELHCLATAIFYESRSESHVGQLAVGRVIVNRARSGRFPATLCGVVKQPGQFSFVKAGRLPPVNTSSNQFQTALAVAQVALDASWESPAEGALFFHATHVSPRWRLKRVGTVGNHVFYR